jgi:hypothetical protein
MDAWPLAVANTAAATAREKVPIRFPNFLCSSFSTGGYFESGICHSQVYFVEKMNSLQQVTTFLLSRELCAKQGIVDMENIG